MLLGVGPLTGLTVTASALGTVSGGHSQVHTAYKDGTDLASIQRQNKTWAATTFLNQCATALDGSTDVTGATLPDLCIPGLNSTDNMIPQGMTYYRQKNWVLVSSYYNGSGKSSVVYALDMETGDFVAQFNLLNKDGTPCTAHVGGIAASEYNLYIADEGSTISYVPLSELNVTPGTKKDITIVDTATIGELGDGGTSFCSIDAGILWTGNFYRNETLTDKKYTTPANSKYHSMIFGYALSGSSSAFEWDAFKNGAIKSVDESGNVTERFSNNCVGNPTYSIAVPNDITKIQCALVSEGRLYMGTSYGRHSDCDFYVANIDLNDALTENGNVTYTVGGTERKAYLFYSYKTFGNHLYMNEGMFMLNHELYILTESAAYKYYGEDRSDKCDYPTDVVWRLDPYALMGEVTPGSDEEEVYYQRVNDLNEIGEDDEYIIVFKSENTEGGNSILYAIDSRGGYNNTALPKMSEGAVANQDSVSDNMGIIGKKITNYTLTNGGKKLVLNNADDDVHSIRWKIEKDGNAVRMANSDSYFANTPYLYFGSRLMFMTMGQNTRFAKVTIGTAVDNGTTYFRFYFNGNRAYYMFCNDGTISKANENYTRYYKQEKVKEANGTFGGSATTDHKYAAYYNCEEVPGTFHMDAFCGQNDYNSGNKLNYDSDGKSSSGWGATNNMGADVAEKYTYFSIYRRMVRQNGTLGKSNLFTNKTSAVSSDGTFSIDLNTYATGQTQSALSDGSTPLDVVLVVDRSGSMYDEQDCRNYNANYNLSFNDADRTGKKDIYYKLGEKYYKIGRGSYSTANYTEKTGNLGPDEIGDNTYYKHSDGYYYKLQSTNIGYGSGGKKAYVLYFIDIDGNYWLLYNYDDKCCKFDDGRNKHPAHFSGTSLPSNDDLKKESNKHNCYYCYRSGHTGKYQYNGVYYTPNGTATTHYYLYFDAEGTRYYLSNTGMTTTMPSEHTSASDIIYTGIYYLETNVTRLRAFEKGAEEFIDQLNVDAAKYNVDHRVAVVGFGNDDGSANPTFANYWARTGVWNKNAGATDGSGSFSTGDTDGITDSAYASALYSSSDPTVKKAISTIGDDDHSYVCAAPNHGLKMAYNILDKSAAKNEYKNGTRKAVIVFITDGVPGNPEKKNALEIAKIYANASIAWAKQIKDLGLAEIYSVYLGSDGLDGFDVDAYMSGVSSNYPNATGYPGYQDGAELGELGTKTNYYKQVRGDILLSKLLDDIVYDQTTSGTAVSLNDKAVLKDVLSSSFSFPKTAEGEVDTSKVKVTLKIQNLLYDTKGVLTYGDISDADGVTYSFSKNADGLDEINVQGFDYTANYVSTDHPGKQLLVKIEGVVANDGVAGNDVATNDASSGIYNFDGDKLAELPLRMFPVPEVDIPVYDYVFDFGAVMPVKTQAYTLLAVSDEPTKLNSSSYTLSAENVLGGKAEIKEGNVLDLTMSLQNSYIYAFLKDGENSYKWAKCNLIPASNVYFEETSLTNAGGEKQSWSTLGTSTVTEQAVSSASDIYGFDNVYYGGDSVGFSGGSALKATVNSTNKQSNKVTFRFTGTAFDLISACGPNTGVLAVKVVGKEHGEKKYFVVDTYYTDANYLSGGLAYNVPVMKFEGQYDTYDVEIGSLYLNSAGAVKGPSKVRSFALLNNIETPSVKEMLASAGVTDLDGFDIETVWMDDNSVLNGGTGSARPAVRRARAANGVAAYSAADVSLDAYIDAVRVYKPYGANDPDTYIDGERNAQYVNVLDALKSGDISGTADKTLNYFELSNDNDELTFANYESTLFGGPQNEIYLKKGAGISFTLNGFDPQKSSVMISLRAVRAASAADNNVVCRINGNEFHVNSANELYYNLTGLLAGINSDGNAFETNVITIVNESDDNLLAIDYIKVVDAKLGSDENNSKENTETIILESLNSKAVDFDPFSSFTRPSTDEASDGTDIILPTPGDSGNSGGSDLSFIDSVVRILNKIIELILNISKVPW